MYCDWQALNVILKLLVHKIAVTVLCRGMGTWEETVITASIADNRTLCVSACLTANISAYVPACYLETLHLLLLLDF